jgi:hypothetical protein
LKFLKYWEVPEESINEAIAKWGKFLEKLEKTPENYPTYVFPPHFEDTMKGISI